MRRLDVCPFCKKKTRRIGTHMRRHLQERERKMGRPPKNVTTIERELDSMPKALLEVKV